MDRPVRESKKIDSWGTPDEARVGRSRWTRGASSIVRSSVTSGTNRLGCWKAFSLMVRTRGTTCALAARETLIHTRTAAQMPRALEFITLLCEVRTNFEERARLEAAPVERIGSEDRWQIREVERLRGRSPSARS